MRVTPARLDAWVADMRRLGRENGTIREYLMVLHAILVLVDPAGPPRCILHPRGASLARLLPSSPKSFPALDTEDVMQHVRALHAAGLATPSTPRRRAALRDAALFALLLRRAPRVGNLAAMRIGTHLHVLPEGGFEVRFAASEIKNRRPLAWELDAETTKMLRDYLRHARPHLAGAAGTDAVWMGTHGRALDVVGIQGLVMRRTRAWLGEAVGPHTARKWLRSTAARRSPEAAFDAAEVLGHSPAVSLRHYAEANAIGAAQRFAKTIADQRRATAGLAERAFRTRPEDAREDAP